MIELELTRPVFLWAMPLVLVVVYFHRRSLVDFSRRQGLTSAWVRGAILVLLVLALSGLTWVRSTHRQYVVFAVDQSVSVSRADGEKATEMIRAAEKHGGRDGMAAIRFPQDAEEYVTDLAGAIEQAAASAPSSYVPHVVLMSDGNETHGDVLAKARALGVRISTIGLSTRDDPEAQVTQVIAPPRVREGEAFFLDVSIDVNRDSDATVEVYRGPHRVGREPVELKRGANYLRIRQTLDKQRVGEFTVRLVGAADTLLDNNEASALVFAEGKPRVLMIDNDLKASRYLAQALREQDIEMEVRPPTGMPTTLADLQNFELLIISNVPATGLTLPQMETVRTWVSELGGGLLMIGGDQSYGLGGYYKSVIEQVLPIRSDFEKEKKKPSLAMMLVIDKSGSMGGLKIELAKDAARSAVELLGPRDQVGVLAFDGSTYEICELHPASDRAYVMDRIASITAGGGTNIAPAMQKALDALTAAIAKLKHVIILSDGISMPGDFEGVAAGMASSKITASTVGVGKGADQELLKRVAEIGKGRFYFTDDPTSIPQIFAKETLKASESAIQEDAFRPRLMRKSDVLADIDFAAAPFLLGYVSTTAKATSEVILTSDEGEPVLAWWRYGLGMTAAFTSDASSRWSAEWVGWSQFGQFWAQVVRHVMRKSDETGAIVQVTRQDDRAVVAVDVADENGGYRHDALLEATIVRPNLSREVIALSQTAPGRYEATFDAVARGAYHVEIIDRSGGNARPVQSRGLVVGYPPELRIAPTNDELLRAISDATGGISNPDVAAIFAPTDRTAPDPMPLRPWLVGLAIVLFVFDVALRRIDMTGRRSIAGTEPGNGDALRKGAA